MIVVAIGTVVVVVMVCVFILIARELAPTRPVSRLLHDLEPGSVLPKGRF